VSSDFMNQFFICSKSIADLNIKTKGTRGASYGQLMQLSYFAKQGVKVRLK
jgi:hypothetical protein